MQTIILRLHPVMKNIIRFVQLETQGFSLFGNSQLRCKIPGNVNSPNESMAYTEVGLSDYTLPLTSNWSLFKLNFSDPVQIKLK